LPPAVAPEIRAPSPAPSPAQSDPRELAELREQILRLSAQVAVLNADAAVARAELQAGVRDAIDLLQRGIAEALDQNRDLRADEQAARERERKRAQQRQAATMLIERLRRESMDAD
jgi:hypothetical protein